MNKQHSIIYSSTDGIWVIYFAILDRKKFPERSLFNSCLQARFTPDQLSDPIYFFSITHSVLIQKHWCDGAIYILPCQSLNKKQLSRCRASKYYSHIGSAHYPSCRLPNYRLARKIFLSSIRSMATMMRSWFN